MTISFTSSLRVALFIQIENLVKVRNGRTAYKQTRSTAYYKDIKICSKYINLGEYIF